MAIAMTEGARTAQELEVELSYGADPEVLGQFDVITVGVRTYHHDLTLNISGLFGSLLRKMWS